MARHRLPRTARARRASLATAGVVATLVAGGLVVGGGSSAHAAASDNAAFLAHLNGLRAAHGLPALSVSGDLTSIATAHSQAMSARQTIFHNGSLTSQVANWQVVGENVGMGGSVASIDAAFDASPEHYANETSTAYTQVGIGTAYDNRGYIYVTLDFRKPMGAVAVAPKPAPVAAAPVAAAPPRTAVVPRRSTTRTITVPSAAAATPAATAAATQAPVATAPKAVAKAVVPTAPAAAAAPTGTDPVANALAFSRLLASLG